MRHDGGVFQLEGRDCVALHLFVRLVVLELQIPDARLAERHLRARAEVLFEFLPEAPRHLVVLVPRLFGQREPRDVATLAHVGFHRLVLELEVEAANRCEQVHAPRERPLVQRPVALLRRVQKHGRHRAPVPDLRQRVDQLHAELASVNDLGEPLRRLHAGKCHALLPRKRAESVLLEKLAPIDQVHQRLRAVGKHDRQHRLRKTLVLGMREQLLES
mmetsp:Transcript_17315/g.43036  ORF Transcript_17315/g.43036 Transcript_17315/m.43036 type:complete len:217 (+) Transcript_17315:2141-2791(+)